MYYICMYILCIYVYIIYVYICICIYIYIYIEEIQILYKNWYSRNIHFPREVSKRKFVRGNPLKNVSVHVRMPKYIKAYKRMC